MTSDRGPHPPWTGSEVDGFASRVRGCLLGGAVGDALGAPVEFLSLERVLAVTGESGVRAYLPARFEAAQGFGLITDDTQMTMFIVEGIIRARVREDRGLGFTVGVTDHAMRRWLDTQDHAGPTGDRDGWLQAESWLYSRRAPGNTCLGALRSADPGRFGELARNDSKGCGGVMRSAPFGFLAPVFGSEAAFDLAATSAGYTHGHPTGQISSGALGYLIAELVGGATLSRAVDATMSLVTTRDPNGETTHALRGAWSAAHHAPGSTARLESLGGGWVAEEALAIAVYSALSYPRPEQMLDALALAVTHSGDSDSTGAICGNILGAAHGLPAVPAELVFEVEGRSVLLTLADDVVLEMTAQGRLHGDYGPSTRWTDRYPGW
jgi:ADP-ribosylglycohydrolase